MKHLVLCALAATLTAPVLASNRDLAPTAAALAFFLPDEIPDPYSDIKNLATFVGTTSDGKACEMNISEVIDDIMISLHEQGQGSNSPALIVTDSTDRTTYTWSGDHTHISFETRQRESELFPPPRKILGRLEAVKRGESFDVYLDDRATGRQISCSNLVRTHKTPATPGSEIQAPVEIRFNQEFTISADRMELIFVNGKLVEAASEDAAIPEDVPYCRVSLAYHDHDKMIRKGRTTTLTERGPLPLDHSKEISCSAGEAHCQDGWKTVHSSVIYFTQLKNGEDNDATFESIYCSNNRYVDESETPPDMTWAELRGILEPFTSLTAK